MKNIVLAVYLLFSIISCKSQSQLEQINEYSTKILGTWIEEDDNNYKLVFLENGICKEYAGTELLISYNYFLVGNNCEGFSANNII